MGMAHTSACMQDMERPVFSSSHHLNLELLCTHGTPVRKFLRYLPVLPIAIHYPGYIKESDEGNIVAALKHPDRVRAINLGAPCPVLGKMATATQGPFLALTHLALESTTDGIMPIHSDGFLCAPHLQELDLDGIPFPAALTPLLSARDLVDVSIRGIFNAINASPISTETLVVSLAALSGLKYLTLGFRWPPPRPVLIHRHPIRRTVLPALTRFYFEGLLEYLVHFVAQIDAPQLDGLGIEYSEYWDEEQVADYQIPQPLQVHRSFRKSQAILVSARGPTHGIQQRHYQTYP
jgi:hypothetical protein